MAWRFDPKSLHTRYVKRDPKSEEYSGSLYAGSYEILRFISAPNNTAMSIITSDNIRYPTVLLYAQQKYGIPKEDPYQSMEYLIAELMKKY